MKALQTAHINQWEQLSQVMTNENPPLQVMANDNSPMYAGQNLPMEVIQMHILSDESHPVQGTTK